MDFNPVDVQKHLKGANYPTSGEDLVGRRLGRGLGYFEAKLDFTAKDGQATLLVGEGNPRDAAFGGVEVPIFLEGG